MSQFIQGYDAANKRVKAISVDTSGHLQVDVVSMTGGGDATAANQVVNHTKLDDIDSSLDKIKLAIYTESETIDNTTKGCLIMGRDGSNNAKPVHITSNGDLEVEIADFVKGQATMASSFPVVLSSDQSAVSINLTTDSVGLATGSKQTAANASLGTIESNTTASKPDMNQSTLSNASLITAGSNTSEIDMEGYNHLCIYGSSTVNFGSFCLIRRSVSAGTDFLDSSQVFSASDPTGGSDYHLAGKFENVGSRYISFRNMDSSSQTVTLYAVKSR